MAEAFGLRLRIPKIRPVEDLDQLLSEVAKRSGERKVLRSFLCGEDFYGRKRFEMMLTKASKTAKIEKDPENFCRQAEEEVLEDLKGMKTVGGLTVYEDLVMQTINKIGDFKARKFMESIRRDKKKDIPDSFPGLHKKAEAILRGKLHSEIGTDECRAYLQKRAFKDLITDCAKDLFFAVNHGLAAERVVDYMAIMFELRMLFIKQPTNESALKENILRAVKGEVINLIHIKCSRFTYPEGKRLEMVAHTGEVRTLMKDGREIVSICQTELTRQLQHVKDILVRFGLSARLVIIVNDQDLEDHFLAGDLIVPAQDIKKAKTDIDEFTSNLRKESTADLVIKLTDYLRQKGLDLDFYDIRQRVNRELKAGKSLYPEGYVESEVDNRFAFNQEIFEEPTDRNYARERICLELASMQALGVLDGRTMGIKENLFLVQKDMGNDNNFTGGHGKTALPVVFMDLDY